MLQFHFEPDVTKAAGQLAGRLTSELQAGRSVVWLVSGGSNIPLSVEVMRQLPAGELANLRCLLADERYGLPGHPDSNWQGLAEAGFLERFGAEDAAKLPAVLMPDMTLDDTCIHYAGVVARTLDSADVVIGQFGIGGDGHIAGILPRSAAITDDPAQTVVGYDSGRYQRITLTPPVLRRVSAAYAYVYGETKRDALARLQAESLPVSEQPAQLLKELPEVYIFTDQQLPLPEGQGTDR